MDVKGRESRVYASTRHQIMANHLDYQPPEFLRPEHPTRVQAQNQEVEMNDGNCPRVSKGRRELRWLQSFSAACA